MQKTPCSGAKEKCYTCTDCPQHWSFISATPQSSVLRSIPYLFEQNGLSYGHNLSVNFAVMTLVDSCDSTIRGLWYTVLEATYTFIFIHLIDLFIQIRIIQAEVKLLCAKIQTTEYF